MAPHSPRRLALITFCFLPVLLAWDASDLDMRLAFWSGGVRGFPLAEYWLLTSGLHEGGRIVSWLLAMWLTLGVWWPVGWLRRLAPRERVQLIATTLIAVLAVSSLKAFSMTSCPWDLAAFGGVARHVSHWSWLPDGGSGRCFPAGHASSGFAFVGGYFVLRHTSTALARTWLVLALSAGFALGVGQQIRGAHFMSHTLWTAWLCWCIAFAIDALQRLPALSRASATAAMPPVAPAAARPEPLVTKTL